MGLTVRKHHPPARRQVGPTDKTTIKSSKFIILTWLSTDFRLSTGRDERGAQPPGGKGDLRAHSEIRTGFLDTPKKKHGLPGLRCQWNPSHRHLLFILL